MITILLVVGIWLIGFALSLAFSFGIEEYKAYRQHWFRLAKCIFWPITLVVYIIIFCLAIVVVFFEDVFGDVWKNLRKVPKK